MNKIILAFMLISPLLTWHACNQPKQATTRVSEIMKAENDTGSTKHEAEGRSAAWYLDQNRYFDYSLLSDTHLTVKAFGYASTYNCRESCVQEIDFIDTNNNDWYSIRIVQEQGLKLKINDQQFMIDSIFAWLKGDRDNRLLVEFMSLQKAIVFTFDDTDYATLFFETFACPTCCPTTYLALFEINENKIELIFSREQCCHTIYCFNDFNRDGYLDFADWLNSESKKLRLFSIVKDSLVEDTASYVILKHDTALGNSDRFVIDIDKWPR